MSPNDSRKIVLSGLRPTGRVHLGNYWGAVKNWVDLQDDYRCHYFVADLHALTTDYADTSAVREATLEAVTDWLSVGLDPEKAVVFVQSRVPQTAELALVFGMVTPLGWLERVPTYKEQLEQLREKDLGTFGFLGYPVLMTADIALYLAHYVPVGKDQESHLEICREIVRRFNSLYGEVFPEPRALFTSTPKVPGLDGRKMSKSYGNTINLSDSAEEVRAKVMSMVTDPKRARRSDPGDPDTCNLFPFHGLYSPPDEVAEVDRECRTAARGCVDCKKHLIRNMNAALEPVRERRAAIVARPGWVREVLEAGNATARGIASETMDRVTDAMKLF
ncbi:tryptophan--tRNA ligase [Acidobacteria bacterium ACD]|nr:MAG: tryptophan--tRNA ligase [Acidobacteriota bacterium]MCE7960032.1 tryptophan--tRNA ligase [Acidobacteria bacterium ACB2]MDL1950100.1 tryptophan--tRNA ligase [Acidobacteria bacterium ACD]